MSTMIIEVYNAFKVAGVPDDEAQKAAEAISNAQTATKTDIESVKDDVRSLDKKLILLDGKVTLIHWMLGFNLAFTMVVLYKLLFV